MTKNRLAIPVFLSPIIVLLVLLETSENNAYPSDADSLGIPLFTYWFLFFPISLGIFSQVRKGKIAKPEVYFWNRDRNWFSAFSLILTIYPLGLFWFAFLLVGVSTQSYGTIIATVLMIFTILIVRTQAIQPVPDHSST